MYTRIIFLAVLPLIIGTSVSSGQQTAQEKEVTKTLNEFHQAIAENDTPEAQNLLSDSVRILEGGNIERKEKYLSHHFHSDGKFLRSMNREVKSRKVTAQEKTAWIATQTRTWGTYSDRKLDLYTLELAVLKKEDGKWKITALHWSSAARN